MRDSLIEALKDYTDIITAIYDNNGEINETLETALVTVETRIANKVDSYDAVIRRLKAEAELWDRKKREADSIKKSCEHALEFLNSRIKSVLEVKGELHGNEVTAKLVKNPPSLVLDRLSLPEKYLKTTVIVEPDKDKIKEDLKRGVEIMGAALESGYRVKFTPKKGIE